MVLLEGTIERATHVATSKLVECPDCEGCGEIRTNVARDSNGVWDGDSRVCTWCDGTGQIEVLRCQGVDCPTWFDPREQLCAHGEPVCDDHRHECGECMLDAKDAS
jgi:hypothetical protein